MTIVAICVGGWRGTRSKGFRSCICKRTSMFTAVLIEGALDILLRLRLRSESRPRGCGISSFSILQRREELMSCANDRAHWSHYVTDHTPQPSTVLPACAEREKSWSTLWPGSQTRKKASTCLAGYRASLHTGPADCSQSHQHNSISQRGCAHGALDQEHREVCPGKSRGGVGAAQSGRANS